MGSTSSFDKPTNRCITCDNITKGDACICLDKCVFCMRCSVVQLNKMFGEEAKKTADRKKKLDDKTAHLEQKNKLLNNKTADLEHINKLLNEKTAECVDKDAELSVLKTSLTFLRLGSISDQPGYMKHSDVVIVVQGRPDELVQAHRFMLSSKSSVFRTMFNIGMSEETTRIIHIDDASLPAIRAMINFCYTAKIDFTDEVSPEEVFAVAHKYEIFLLREICENHLIRTLDNRNLAKRLRLAKKCDVAGLAAEASKYLKSRYDQLIGDVLEELC